MKSAERTAAVARRREADVACLRAQAWLVELDATIASADGDHPTLPAWYAWRADLLQLATEHAARSAALSAALYVRNATHDPVQASAA